MALTAKQFYAEDTRIMRQAGKSLIVSSINFTCRKALGRPAKGETEHSYDGIFRRSSQNNIGGEGGIYNWEKPNIQATW
jgi:hypothetical protein